MSTSRLSIIAVIGARTRALGKDNKLLFQIPEDMQRFKGLTMGHPVVMGRKTWESIPWKFRPLKGRTNFVISRQKGYAPPEAHGVATLGQAIERAREAPGGEEVFVIGGGQLYEDALPFADRLYLTLVDDDTEGDVFFPEYPTFTKVIQKEVHPDHVPPFTYLTLEK